MLYGLSERGRTEKRWWCHRSTAYKNQWEQAHYSQLLPFLCFIFSQKDNHNTVFMRLISWKSIKCFKYHHHSSFHGRYLLNFGRVMISVTTAAKTVLPGRRNAYKMNVCVHVPTAYVYVLNLNNNNDPFSLFVACVATQCSLCNFLEYELI